MEAKTELTGEQLTELFFKWKGWEFKKKSHDWWYDYWIMEDGKSSIRRLPELHKSLDLQEEWLWPELRKNEVWDMDSIYLKQMRAILYEKEPATELLKAGLKALGVLDESSY